MKKLGIELIIKVDSKGKSSFIAQNDLQRMADAMGKTLVTPASTQTENNNETPSRGVGDAKDNEMVQQNFMLQLKIKEQEEVIKSSNELLSMYKEQNNHLQTQQQQAQSQVNGLYLQIIQTTNKATAYGISAIALFVILILMV